MLYNSHYPSEECEINITINHLNHDFHRLNKKLKLLLKIIAHRTYPVYNAIKGC